MPPLAEETRNLLETLLPAEASLANPVDMLGSATAASYEAVLPLVLDDPAVDAAIVLFVPAVSATAGEVAAAVARAGGGEKPVLAVVMSAEGIPAALRAAPRSAAAFVYPESAARALGRAAERADWLRRPLGSIPNLQVDRVAAAAVVDRALADRDDAWLEPADTRALLLAYGIPLVGEAVAHSAEEAIEAARCLRLPRRRQDRRRRRSQDRKRRHRARPRRCRLPSGPQSTGSELPVIVQPMVPRRRRAPRRPRPGSRLRPTGRLRPRRHLRRADRRRRLPHRPAHRHGRAGTGHDRQSREGSSRAFGARRRLTSLPSSILSAACRASAKTCPPSPSST